MKENLSLQKLRGQFARSGTVEWIGLRPSRKVPLQSVESVALDPRAGLAGDHYSGRSGRRHVTLINQDHLVAAARSLGRSTVEPAEVRRNIVVAGINLLALKQTRFRLGTAELEYTDECHPCSRMEEVLGTGGYNAMRGHGGICARVVTAGEVALGDELTFLSISPSPLS